MVPFSGGRSDFETVNKKTPRWHEIGALTTILNANKVALYLMGMEKPLLSYMRSASETNKSLDSSSAESHPFTGSFQRLDKPSNNDRLR